MTAGDFGDECPLPLPSMYGIFTYVYHTNKPNVGKYTSPMDAMGFLHRPWRLKRIMVVSGIWV